MNPLQPSVTLLVKLGSMARHAEEMLDPDKGHEFDLSTFRTLMKDPEIIDWFEAMDKLALLPVKR